ncbi:AbgT family transporter [Clostridium aestuarii]|uniref:AbgT family transporter n=1 Tax=Clostridium aestuarii TaxID=338193 RepID=A0ABT4CVX1_9CLOT|nr:AbgT family transporter [Clostridium aestuarii]MCY6483134.1 AbgT family transporter [Clostridium aestuarii]
MSGAPKTEKQFSQVKPKNSRFERFLNRVEIIGNKMADPVTLFFYLCIIVLILSWICASAKVAVVHPLTKETVPAVSLLTKANLQKILMNLVNNFEGFPPLGLVLVIMIGVGVAEKSGMMQAAMEHTIAKAPKRMITAIIILAGILANGAGDAGFIVLPPLAAIVFLGIGRHPLVGMFAAFAGVSGGFAANFIVNMSDVLAASFTIPAAQMMDANYRGTPAMNYYFIIVSTIFLLIAGVYVTEKIVAPRLGEYTGVVEQEERKELSPQEVKALKYAGLSLVILIIVIIGLSIGKEAFLKDSKTYSLLAYKSPLMQGIVPILTVVFLIPGYIYGKMTGSIKSDKDAIGMMGKSMSDMGPYIVLAFMAAQFLAFFKWSNLGVIMSVKGAEFLKNIGATGPVLIIGFIILAGVINLFVGSASAKWAIMAPIFVPMFLILGYDPALTQAAYRIGDSITNCISPLFPYFPILVAFAKKYDKKAGLGTMISNMLPYSIVFFVCWAILLVIFIVFNIPLGPGGGIYYTIN